jgi:hypothetical protein
MSQAQPADNHRVVAHTYQPTTHNHTTTATPSIYPTTHISTTRRYKSYHPRSCLYINQTHTTKITLKHQNKKISLISRIAESFT